MDGEQTAFGFVHFSLQIPLECTCTAYLWPKLIETTLFLRKTEVSSCIHRTPGATYVLQHLISGGPNLPSGVHFDTSFWKPQFSNGKLMYHRASLDSRRL